MRDIGVVGPHGSGNRLLQRALMSFDDMRVTGKTFPSDNGWMDRKTEDGITSWDPFEGDFYFVTMREVSPWCMIREGRPGAPTVPAAVNSWGHAYYQIYEHLGPFWERPDVHLVRYRDFIDHGAPYVIAQLSAVLDQYPCRPLNEQMVDGDLKYRDDPIVEAILGPEPWSREKLRETIIGEVLDRACRADKRIEVD